MAPTHCGMACLSCVTVAVAVRYEQEVAVATEAGHGLEQSPLAARSRHRPMLVASVSCGSTVVSGVSVFRPEQPAKHSASADSRIFICVPFPVRSIAGC